MRMEELSDSRYIKGTDTVEHYLLDLVQKYFEKDTTAISTSREFIIKKAVKRMKEELDFEDIGVLSITLPDGTIKTGPVSLSAYDIGAEPIIAEKKTAFNVDFGEDQNTACEGNDPRLSDARNPLPHQHEVDDIIGLSGLLSTLSGTINRVNGYAHEHDNIDILNRLVYSGTKSNIDIGEIDKSVDKVQQMSADIKTLIKQYQNNLPSISQNIQNSAQQISQQVTTLQNSITANNNSCLNTASQYTNSEIDKVKAQFNTTANGGYVTKDKLSNVLQNAMTFIGSIDISLNTLSIGSTITQALSNSIQTSLSSAGQTINDCHFVFHFKHRNNSGQYILSSIPHMIINSSRPIGQITASYFKDTFNNTQIIVSFEPMVSGASYSLNDTHVTVDVYARQKVTVV